MSPETDPSANVRNYLTAMEARELEKAKTYLAPDFIMTFPGNISFSRIEELIEWSKYRYQSVGKTFHQFDQCSATDHCVVYCFGTLQGIWLDGSAFEGIRFIDRFVLVDGYISSQLVWNDLSVTT